LAHPQSPARPARRLHPSWCPAEPQKPRKSPPKNLRKPQQNPTSSSPVKREIFWPRPPLPGSPPNHPNNGEQRPGVVLARSFMENIPSGRFWHRLPGCGRTGDRFPGVSLPWVAQPPATSLPTLRVGDAEQLGGLSDSSRRSQLAKTSGIYPRNGHAQKGCQNAHDRHGLARALVRTRSRLVRACESAVAAALCRRSP